MYFNGYTPTPIEQEYPKEPEPIPDTPEERASKVDRFCTIFKRTLNLYPFPNVKYQLVDGARVIESDAVLYFEIGAHIAFTEHEYPSDLYQWHKELSFDDPAELELVDRLVEICVNKWNLEW